MATTDQLIAKVEGACTALGKMGSKEREITPTGTFGKEYKDFRAQVVDAFSELKDIIPPAVKFHRPAMSNSDLTIATYAEIHSYYETIKNLLHDLDR